LKDTFQDLLPKELFHAPKHGFGVPIGEWLETALREKLLRYADAEFLDEQGLFSYEEIHKIIENHFTHREDKYSELWTFFVFQNWYERYFKV
jgi:asparagine synthase (glutamine-hydrolysing)